MPKLQLGEASRQPLAPSWQDGDSSPSKRGAGSLETLRRFKRSCENNTKRKRCASEMCTEMRIYNEYPYI